MVVAVVLTRGVAGLTLAGEAIKDAAVTSLAVATREEELSKVGAWLPHVAGRTWQLVGRTAEVAGVAIDLMPTAVFKVMLIIIRVWEAIVIMCKGKPVLRVLRTMQISNSIGLEIFSVAPDTILGIVLDMEGINNAGMLTVVFSIELVIMGLIRNHGVAKVDNPKLAKVTVDGDDMTIPDLIDQLKKIVPSDKFKWEVFHFKDNIYRVKFPSKQEVQRLKNFGTYICTDRESCLSFDLWSSLEEPMYTLPEVWVRVSGLPSDIRTDYLSLWGVGTLFGKTLDVDMAYTRRNKVLRTKIGCLDRSLIPTTSDIFIRRGFFKLHFEVEEANGSQEVDMAEVNNDDGGNDDAHNGEHNKEGGNAMDMDPKGLDEGDASNKDKQDGEVNINGIQGMQLHAHHLDEIKIGSINVQLSPKGTPLSVQNLGKKEQFIMPLSHVQNLMQNDNFSTDYHADLVPRESASGLPQVTSSGAQQLQQLGTLQADSCNGSSGQQGQLTGNNGSSQRACDTFKRAAKSAVRAGSGVAARDAVAVEAMTCSAQKITGPWASCEHMHAQRTTDGAAGLPLVDTRLPLSPSVPKADGTGQGAGHAGQLSADSVQQAQQLAACTDAGDAGFSAAAAAVGGKRGGVLWPQTIQGEQEPALPADQVDRGNDGVIMATDRPMIGMHCSDLLGSSVHQKNAAKVCI
ncbi:hypothetical protein ACQ4PT_050886 [Festuca glaucescens]